MHVKVVGVEAGDADAIEHLPVQHVVADQTRFLYPTGSRVCLDGPDVVAPTGIPTLAPDELDAIRIRAHWPSEAEIDGKATPAMTGIVDHTVSFDKGCYTGQEFVARVHYRDAAPPRHLTHLAFEPGSTIAQGAEVTVGGEPVGKVTSVQGSFGVGLAYCKRSVELPARGTVRSTAVVLT